MALEPAQLAGTADAAGLVQNVRGASRSRGCGLPLLIAALALSSSSCGNARRSVSYAEARTLVDRRCVECHSERPTNRAFPIAPQGVMLDTAAQMKKYARRIEATVVVERTMPIANMSGMTDEERQILGGWVKTGAIVP